MKTTDLIDNDSLRTDIPDFGPGDTLKVHVKVIEGTRSRIQVFDLSGEFLRAFGADVLIAPTVIATAGDELVLTDFLGARLSFLDAEDRLLGHLYASPAAPARNEWPDAWPNARDAEGRIVRPTLAPGVLNSPHAVAAAGDGSLYVTEWLIGGRVTKLAPAYSAAQRLP